jgi:Phosphotransferase enzyme family
MSDNTIVLSRKKPSPEGEGRVTTARMQEVGQRLEQLPRGNQDKGKSLISSSHPSLFPEGEGNNTINSPATGTNGISHEFAMLMDTTKMQALFQQELPDCHSGHWTLTDCQIQHPRYKTYLNPQSRNKSFLALAYHLKGINEQTHKADDRILYVKAFLGSRSDTEYLKACSEVGFTQQNTVLHIAKLGLVGWFFPCDPALPWLPKVLNLAEIKNYFANFLLLQQNAPSYVIKAITLTIINYRPEIRCTYRYDIKRLSGTTYTVYGKTFADDSGAEIHRRIVHLYPRTESNPESFVIPRLLGYDYTLHTLWLEGLHGKLLVNSINEQNADQLMASIARHLVDFHSAEISGLEVILEDEQFTEIRKKCAKLQKAYPDISDRIERLLCALEEQKPDTTLNPMRLIHGDFHIQQLLLLNDNRIALFDFDELAIANPLLDVANFCADLYSLTLPKGLTEKLINRLFCAYKTFSSDALNESLFSWHLRVQFLTRAYRAYIQRKPNLEHLIEQFLVAAEIGYVDAFVDEERLG